MAERVVDGASIGSWLVADVDGILVGYTYATPFAARSGYRKSAESVVYVAKNHHRQGCGTKLYSALIEQLRDQGLHCAIGQIALPNQESVALHEKLGFRKAGGLSEVGWKFGKWVDIGYWQLIF
jgi:phosphinothricin acetyltransferase